MVEDSRPVVSSIVFEVQTSMSAVKHRLSEQAIGERVRVQLPLHHVARYSHHKHPIIGLDFKTSWESVNKMLRVFIKWKDEC